MRSGSLSTVHIAFFRKWSYTTERDATKYCDL